MIFYTVWQENCIFLIQSACLVNANGRKHEVSLIMTENTQLNKDRTSVRDILTHLITNVIV